MMSQKIRLGDYCDIEKGKTGIKKAIPGEYPMVVTAEERITHNTYDFDCKAVLIPLVSSTGHGHASINRLHYQEGRFALGTILAAVIVKDEKILDPKFLFIYLSYFKDQLLVPLMKGSANVSLNVTKISNLEIPLPTIDEQRKIVDLEQEGSKILEFKKQMQFQRDLIAELKLSILRDVKEEENDEVMIGDFLHRIKRPVTLEHDKEYQLVTIKLYHNGVTQRCLKKGGDIKSNMYEVNEGDFILSGIDARNGAFGIVPGELDGAIVTNDFWYFKLDENVIDRHFFLEMTKTSWFDEICRLGSDGTTQRIRLQKDKFFNQKIKLPSIEKQKSVVEIFNLCNDVKNEVENNEESASILMRAVLKESFSS